MIDKIKINNEIVEQNKTSLYDYQQEEVFPAFKEVKEVNRTIFGY